MKKIIIILLMLLATNICIATEKRCKDNNYKAVKCNEQTKVCIIRDKYLNYGLSDNNLNIILPIEYMQISFCKNGDTNIEIVKKDSNGKLNYGRVNKFGKIIIEPKYSSIRKSNISGKYNIELNGYYGLADIKTGNIDIKPEYSYVSQLRNGCFWVENSKQQEGIVANNGKIIIPTEYRQVNLMNGDKYYRVNKLISTNVVYGIIDTNGKFILPLEYSWIDEAGKTDKNGAPSYSYGAVKNGTFYLFNSKSGKLIKQDD